MKIALMAGSTRTGSINQQLVIAMAQKYAAAGDETTLIDLRDYDMPIYNGDIEVKSGAPDNTHRLAKLLVEQDGIFMCSPEYNGSLSPLLKNTIDWLTRTGNRDHILKPVWSLGSCAMGPMSGIMVMRQMQYIMNRIYADIIPLQLGIGLGAQAFNPDGSFARQSDIDRADKQISDLRLRVRQRRAVSA